jgi:hypothetical protein
VNTPQGGNPLPKASTNSIGMLLWIMLVDSWVSRLIVRDYNGLVIAARSLTKMGNLEPVAAEALTAFHVAEFSKDLGLQNIILEVTCFKW